MKRNIKIAIYSGAIPSTTFIERLINGLAANGNQIFIFGVKNKKVSPANNIHYYSYSGKLSKLIQLIKYSFLLSLFKNKHKRKLDQIIYKKKSNSRLLKVKYYPVLYHKPDIFHLQWAKSIGDWIWVQEFGIKFILSLRGTHITISPNTDKKWSNLYSQYFPQIDGFHSVSKSVANEALKYGIIKSKIKVVYSGLKLNDFPFNPKIKKDNSLRILSVGRSHWTKGYHHALDAIKLLKDLGIAFQYTIVGVLSDEELLFQRSQLDLENEVTFVSELPFDHILSIMQEANILLLPSVEEGIANVVLEAMALGTLVVSTDCGGMNEVISDGKNGFLVPKRDSFAMSSVLNKVSQLSLDEYQNIIKSARSIIEQQHNSDKMIVEIQALNHNVLNNKL